MKKFVIGCLVVVVVLGAAAAGVVYWGYTKVKGTVAQLAQVSDIEKGVRNQSPFSAPDSRELTAAQVDRLVQVQKRVRDKLGAGAAAIEKNYKTLFDKKDASATDLPALLGAYRDLAQVLVDAKRTQVEALNELGMSLGEYRWIRATTYQALGVPFVDMDFGQMAERAREGRTAGTIQMSGAVGDKGPESNVKLAEKYRKSLEDYLPLASFGL